MLQQTQASTVATRFDPFVQQFPNIAALASSSEDEVLSSWFGLGYYRRALRLREAAIQVVERFDGELPQTAHDLCSLPGIGRSTAGAILSCAFNISAPILDANVRRVLARFHAVNGPEETRVADSRLWQLAETHTPTKKVGIYTQAIMDFGSKQCVQTNPPCDTCPLKERCKASLANAVHRYPQSRKSPKIVEVTKCPLVILDSEGACLLKRRGDQGTYARLWETPDLSPNTLTEQTLSQMQLPLKPATICKGGHVSPYNISNKRITEDVTVVKYNLCATELGTPAGTAWFKNSPHRNLGVSVKTMRRIQMARNLGAQS